MAKVAINVSIDTSDRHVAIVNADPPRVRTRMTAHALMSWRESRTRMSFVRVSRGDRGSVKEEEEEQDDEEEEEDDEEKGELLPIMQIARRRSDITLFFVLRPFPSVLLSPLHASTRAPAAARTRPKV